MAKIGETGYPKDVTDITSDESEYDIDNYRYNVYSIIDGFIEDEQIFDDYDQAYEFYSNLVDDYDKDESLSTVDYSITLYDCIFGNIEQCYSNI